MPKEMEVKSQSLTGSQSPPPGRRMDMFTRPNSRWETRSWLRFSIVPWNLKNPVSSFFGSTVEPAVQSTCESCRVLVGGCFIRSVLFRFYDIALEKPLAAFAEQVFGQGTETKLGSDDDSIPGIET